MWERLQREAKRAIAKRAIGELVTGLPFNVRLGLVVCSHRRGNHCDDLELLVPPGPLDAGAFVAAVDPLRPNGRTPLAAGPCEICYVSGPGARTFARREIMIRAP